MGDKWIMTDDVYTIASILACRYGAEDCVTSAICMLDKGFIIKVKQEDYKIYHY